MVSVVMDTPSGYPISDDHLGLKMSYPRSVGPRSVMGWIGVTDSADVFTNVIPYPAIPVAMAPGDMGCNCGIVGDALPRSSKVRPANRGPNPCLRMLSGGHPSGVKHPILVSKSVGTSALASAGEALRA